jgi:hypothetical protein
MKRIPVTPESHRKIVDILKTERAELQGRVDRLTRENAALRKALEKSSGADPEQPSARRGGGN